MKLFEALDSKEKELEVEYYKDSSGKVLAKFNGKSMSLEEFEKLAKEDMDARVLFRATMEQNKYYEKQVKRFKEVVEDLFHQKTKTPDIEIDKGKVKIYTGKNITAYSDEPRVDTKEIKTSGSKDMEAPPWLRRKE